MVLLTCKKYESDALKEDFGEDIDTSGVFKHPRQSISPIEKSISDDIHKADLPSVVEQAVVVNAVIIFAVGVEDLNPIKAAIPK